MANETKQAQHTPGPWEVKRADRDSLPIIQDPREKDIAWVRDGAEWPVSPTFVYVPETIEANARLIAAAPDLLEALKAYVANDANQQLDDDEMYANAVAAIAKAIGASA